MIKKIKKIILVATLPLVLSSNTMAKQVPQLPITTLNSATDKSFADYQGQWLYVDFWASWCVPCKKSFPFMHELQAKYQDSNFKVIAISVDDNKNNASDFLAKQAINFDVFHDPEGKVASYFELPGMPTSYLVDPTGKIVATHVGFKASTKEKLIKQLQAVLKSQ